MSFNKELQNSNHKSNDSKSLILFSQNYSSFLEGNLTKTSLTYELCMIFNFFFKLNIKTVQTHNQKNFNILNQNLPYIVYGGIIIKKEFIYSFLMRLVGLEGKGETEEIFEIQNLEKNILFDFQALSDLYIYYDYNEKTNKLWKFMKFVCQPFSSFKTYCNDHEMCQELRDHLGVCSKFECVQKIRIIFTQVENFLNKKGSGYLELNKRNLTALDLLFYSCYMTVKVVLINANDEYNFSAFEVFKNFVERLDKMVWEKTIISNNYRVLTPNEIDEIIPKVVIPESNFRKYLDCPLDTPEVVLRTKIRKRVITCVFFGILVVFKLAFFNLNFRKRTS